MVKEASKPKGLPMYWCPKGCGKSVTRFHSCGQYIYGCSRCNAKFYRKDLAVMYNRQVL